MLSLPELRGLTGGKSGVIDVACPLCGPYARSPSNRAREVLRIWDDGRFVTFKCARCEAKGWLRDEEGKQVIPEQQPTRKRDRAETAARLWASSTQHGLHEVYLRSRQCLIAPCPNLRSLPASGKHPPAMIARFGNGVVTGVHLTHLRQDGRGKADIELAKITIGPSIGQPIILHETIKRGSLFIAEGIEDAASLVIATKATVWAAGSAGRIAALMPITKDYERVFVAVDQDDAGAKAFQAAKSVRDDIVPLSFGEMDANKTLLRLGINALTAALGEYA